MISKVRHWTWAGRTVSTSISTKPSTSCDSKTGIASRRSSWTSTWRSPVATWRTRTGSTRNRDSMSTYRNWWRAGSPKRCAWLGTRASSSAGARSSGKYWKMIQITITMEIQTEASPMLVHLKLKLYSLMCCKHIGLSISTWFVSNILLLFNEILCIIILYIRKRCINFCNLIV